MTLSSIPGKLVTAFFLTFPAEAFFLNEEQVKLAWLLAVLIMVDSLLGFSASIVNKTCRSSEMGLPFARKVALYSIDSIALFALLVLGSASSYFSWTFSYMALYLILGETLSIFENLSLFGFQTPTRIVSLVNTQFTEFLKKKK